MSLWFFPLPPPSIGLTIGDSCGIHWGRSNMVYGRSTLNLTNGAWLVFLALPEDDPTKREMIRIYNSDTGEAIGEINEEQLEFLIEQLEEESEEDESYYIDNSTIDYLEENGADDDLVTLLRKALGEEDGVEIKIGEEEAAAG